MRPPSIIVRAIGAFIVSALGACATMIGFGQALNRSTALGTLLVLLGVFVPLVFTVGSAITAWERARWRVLAIVAGSLLGGLAGLLAIILHVFGGGGML